MHYLIIIFGLILGLYGLYRFFLAASIKQIEALVMVAVLLVLCVALFYMAITGRLGAALALLVAILPLFVPYFKEKKAEDRMYSAFKRHKQNEGPLTKKEALEILGLKEQSSDEQIQKSYTRLMKKVHPDQEGSAWFAQKLNEARDLLLKD